jgi:hypothetical protein
MWLLVSVGFTDPFYRERFSLLREPAFRQRFLAAAELLCEEYQGMNRGPCEEGVASLDVLQLFNALDGEFDRIADVHRNHFGLIVSEICPSCGIEYEPNADVTYRAQRMADIAAFYRAFGLEVLGTRSERLDHISIEGEFLYLLNAKEAAALSVGRTEQAEVCRLARSKFFHEHVGCWLGVFATLLGRTARSDFYRRLAALTSCLSAIERTDLGLEPVQPVLNPGPPAREEETGCFGCAG